MNSSHKAAGFARCRILTHLLAYSLLSLTAAAITYDEWKVTKFTAEELANPALTNRSADFDSDGKTNLREFALDSFPKSADPWVNINQWYDGAGHLTIVFLRWKTRPNLLYIPQVASSESGPWISGPTAFNITLTDRDANSEWVTARDAMVSTPGTRFIRLYVASDKDNDGLPDEWELQNGLDLYHPFDGTTDIDGDGVSAAQEFADGTDALVNPAAPMPPMPPMPPVEVKVFPYEDGSRLFTWGDNSNNESFFTIRDGTVVLGRVGPGETSFFCPAQD